MYSTAGTGCPARTSTFCKPLIHSVVARYAPANGVRPSNLASQTPNDRRLRHVRWEPQQPTSIDAITAATEGRFLLPAGPLALLLAERAG